MPRTITVKGIGKVSDKPDYVALSMTLESRNKDYDKAVELASQYIEELTQALVAVGYAKEALKTTNFNVHISYNNEKDERGNWKNVFDAYVVTHNLKLEFDFDMERLSTTLSAISGCKSHPQISIAFTVKEPNAIKEELLRHAADNAKQKAEILCAASGVKLGTLLNIDYNWTDINIHSNTRYMLAEKRRGVAVPAMLADTRSIDIEPEDIHLNDSATFIWEIA